MPMVKQKAQINYNLSLTYYYGNQGIPIIPNLRCGDDELLDEFLDAIPKHHLIAIGTHGFIKYKYQQYEWYCFLEKTLPKLQPSGIVVYGSLPGHLFDIFKKKYTFFYYVPWINANRKERQNDNKSCF
jgi:hypothetical protein